MLDADYPEFEYDVPSSAAFHIGKLQGGFSTLGTCNAARRLVKELAAEIDKVA